MSQCNANMSERSDIRCRMNDTVWSIVCLHHVVPRVMKTMFGIQWSKLRDEVILIYILYMLNTHPNYGENQNICVFKSKEMRILLYWPEERTNPVTSHVKVLQDGGALAPKAITKHPFFFKTVTLIMFMYFLIKVEINLLNNVNLTDCFTSTLRLCHTKSENYDNYISVHTNPQ